MGVIKEFQGSYRWLSNMSGGGFYFTYGSWGRFYFRSNEHFYVAMKCQEYSDFIKIVECTNPKQAKKIGRRVKLRKDWPQIKYSVMRFGLRQKFDNNPEIRQLLIDTYPMELQEGNMWRDTTWGICLRTGKGQNILGRMLMQLRGEYINEQ